MKKIVYVTNDLKRQGGVQRLLVDIMSALNHEFTFEVILTKGENEYSEELNNLGVKVHHFKGLSLFKAIKLMNSADLVHAHLFPSSYLALLSNSKKIHTEHNPYYRRRDYALFRIFERFAFKKFIFNVCISKGVKESIQKVLNWSDINNLRVIYNGVDLKRFSGRAMPKSPENTIKIGMLARLTRQKDFETLIESLKILPSNFELLIGGDGDDRKILEEKVEQLGLRSRVFFLGQIANVPEFMNSLNIYVQSSRWEGFGLTCIEAQASGLPCLGTNVPGLNELLPPESLFEVGDIKVLADKIINLMEIPGEYEKSVNYSISNAQKYSIEETNKQYRNLYLDTIYERVGPA